MRRMRVSNAATTLSLAMLFSPFVTSWAVADSIPLDSDQIVIEASEHKFETYLGQQSLFLKGGEAMVQGINFENGVIEFDMAIPYDRGFSGVNFRIGSGDDANTAEQFYIRHHQGGKPDANQYTPVFNGLTGWQLYHGTQFSTPQDFEADAWQHVKVVVNGKRADIYIDDMETVELAVELKSYVTSGGISLFSAFAPARFANLNVIQSEASELKGSPEPYPETPATRVASWKVSSPFAYKTIEGAMTLDEASLGDLTWVDLAAEENGITNLARVTHIGMDAQTVLARVNIKSDAARIVPVDFGYSDLVLVYLNGALLYTGSNKYQSRDYRYLGTIGLFDSVPLALRAGDNELTFAVIESFGGWGIMADIPETPGLAVSTTPK